MSWQAGDKVGTFVQQLVELLGGKRMMDTQLASSYSIKHAKSVNKVLAEISDGTPLTLTQFLSSHPSYFHVMGNVVTAIASPVLETDGSQMKYADVSRGLQTIFKEKIDTTIAAVVGMSTTEYLERKENIFEYDKDKGTVSLQQALLAGPPIADP